MPDEPLDEPLDERPTHRPRRRPRGTFRISAFLLGAALLVVAAGVFVRGVKEVGELTDVSLSETTVRELAHAALQRERAERFLVTGRLDVTATTEVENTRVVLPGILALDLGTSRARVRVPGRIFYGVDLSSFQSSDVRLVSDSIVSVRLGAVRVAAVEPVLEDMEVHTERGWARLPGRSDREAERQAIRLLRSVLRSQGIAHLADSRQPSVNSARAVAALIVPPLRAAGMTDPVVRVELGGDTWTVRPSDTGTPRSRPVP